MGKARTATARPYRFYGRRQGKKRSDRQQHLLDSVLPRVSVAPESLGSDGRQVWLEIGFGGAEHLLGQARANPDVHLIGCEPFLEGVVKALDGIEGEGLANHHKRRLVSTATLDSLARVMRDGASLRIATDHMEYARWILSHCLRHPAFEWTAERVADWREVPADHVTTRYQSKLLAGSEPLFLTFRRRQRSVGGEEG